MIGHSLGRMESSIKKLKPHLIYEYFMNIFCQALVKTFPSSGLLPLEEYTLHGVQLADRGIGQGVRYHHTITDASGVADECVCAVEELVMREEAASGSSLTP